MRFSGFLVIGCAWLVLGAAFPASSQGVADFNEVNSPYDEQHPTLSPGGNLYFTKAYHPQNQGGTADPGDVWRSEGNTNFVYQNPTLVNSLSTSGYDVIVGFLEENSVLVYHDGREKKQGIHQYSRSGNSWSHVKQLELGSFRNQSPHFSGRLSSSREIMVLSLNSFGSYGNEDIYVSFLKENGSWSTPQNLGPGINTYQQEMTPYLSSDNRVLYFSSNGHAGTGGVDIFYAERMDDSWENWSDPQVLDQGNTKGIELSYILLNGEANKGIFTSTQNSEGYGDIHLIQNESPNLTEKRGNLLSTEETPLKDGVVAEGKAPSLAVNPPASNPIPPRPRDQKSEENSTVAIPAGDSITLEKQNITMDIDSNSSRDPSQKILLTVLDINTLTEVDFDLTLLDQDGVKSPKTKVENLSAEGLESVKEIIVSSEGYLPITLKVDPGSALPDPIFLTPASKGLSMVLEKILFKRGTSDLMSEESDAFLYSMADFLIENPGIRILLEGHTDNIGNVVLNKELSLDRASAIRDFLVKQGVEFERIRVTGWGGARPISSNQDEEGRSKNRRVEMVIIEE